MLTNALGGKHAAVEVEIHHERLRDGDRLLLCSDGLNGMMSDEEIAAILNQNPASSDACSALMLDALHRGANDNVTVIVARYTIEQDAAGSALHRGLAPDRPRKLRSFATGAGGCTAGGRIRGRFPSAFSMIADWEGPQLVPLYFIIIGEVPSSYH